MKDFFVSYNRNDKSWAEWIADTLEKNHYEVSIQAWDFVPGSNFVVEMQRATTQCERTIAVLSPDYLASMFTQTEWAVAFSMDPSGSVRKLIPIRVRVCEPPGLLQTIVYCDLVGLDEVHAKTALIGAVSGARLRTANPIFPATDLLEQRVPDPTDRELTYNAFPGCGSAVPLDSLSPQVKSAIDLLGLLRTTRTTFEAQARLRDVLVKRVQQRLVLDPGMQYEEFFSTYLECFEPYERTLFATIRSFTSSVLYKYNQKVLFLIDANPVLARRIEGVTELRNHLLVWLAKYDGVFTSTPEMCLVYVGVSEGVGFPAWVEYNIWHHLENEGKTDALLLAEPPPVGATEERSEGEEHWYYIMKKRWLLKEIIEIDAKLAEERDETIRTELENKLIKRLQQSLSRYSDEIKRISVETINAVKSIAEMAQPVWPKELLSALTKATYVLKDPFGTFEEFYDLLPLLPTLASLDEQRDPQSDLKQLWKNVARELTASAIHSCEGFLDRSWPPWRILTGPNQYIAPIAGVDGQNYALLIHGQMVSTHETVAEACEALEGKWGGTQK
jgi:hypothetical protein